MKNIDRFIRWLPCALVLAAASAHGQPFAAKPVRVVVPFAPGGTVDLIARSFGQKLTEIWKQQVVVDNRPGAGGSIGAELVAKSPANGYTLLLHSVAQAISAGIYRKLPFDPVKDFTPVTQLTATSFFLVVNPKVPVASVTELIALARSRPGKLNFSSSGYGSSPHLAGELLKSRAKIEVIHVPYKGDAGQIPALFADEVQFAFLPMLTALPHVKSGKLHAIAISTAGRNAAVPELPTVEESGLANFQFSGWIGVFAPGGTPPQLARQLAGDFSKALQMPDIVKNLQTSGYEVVGSSPENFAARYISDIGFYTDLVRTARIPLVD
jgi:tripartite-type tricarboxylate transporter receptor subunit TctC